MSLALRLKRRAPGLRDTLVFKFGRPFGVLNSLMPCIGEWVPVSIAKEQVISSFTSVARDGKTGGGTKLFSSDEMSGLACAVVT